MGIESGGSERQLETIESQLFDEYQRLRRKVCYEFLPGKNDCTITFPAYNSPEIQKLISLVYARVLHFSDYVLNSESDEYGQLSSLNLSFQLLQGLGYKVPEIIGLKNLESVANSRPTKGKIRLIQTLPAGNFPDFQNLYVEGAEHVQKYGVFEKSEQRSSWVAVADECDKTESESKIKQSIYNYFRQKGASSELIERIEVFLKNIMPKTAELTKTINLEDLNELIEIYTEQDEECLIKLNGTASGMGVFKVHKNDLNSREKLHIWLNGIQKSGGIISQKYDKFSYEGGVAEKSITILNLSPEQLESQNNGILFVSPFATINMTDNGHHYGNLIYPGTKACELMCDSAPITSQEDYICMVQALGVVTMIWEMLNDVIEKPEEFFTQSQQTHSFDLLTDGRYVKAIDPNTHRLSAPMYGYYGLKKLEHGQNSYILQANIQLPVNINITTLAQQLKGLYNENSAVFHPMGLAHLSQLTDQQNPHGILLMPVLCFGNSPQRAQKCFDNLTKGLNDLSPS